MTAQPVPAERDDRAPMTDRELEAVVAALPPRAGLPSTPEEEDEADRRALDDIANGRVYPHRLVAEWANARNEIDRKPFEDWLADRNG